MTFFKHTVLEMGVVLRLMVDTRGFPVSLKGDLPFKSSFLNQISDDDAEYEKEVFCTLAMI
jgi:hypothetical protein